MSKTDWKTRAVAAEEELARLKGEPAFKSLKDELVAKLPEATDRNEYGKTGYTNPGTLLKYYFEDKPERGFKIIGNDERFNGRNEWPAFTEIFVFEVDGQMHIIEGESDSWEGGWPIYDIYTVKAVKKTTQTLEVTYYEPIE